MFTVVATIWFSMPIHTERALPQFLPPLTATRIQEFYGFTIEGNTAWWQVSPRSGNLVFMHRLDKFTRERTLSRYWHQDAARELIADGVVSRGQWYIENGVLRVDHPRIRIVASPPDWDDWPEYSLDISDVQWTVRPLSADGKPEPLTTLNWKAFRHLFFQPPAPEPEPDTGVIDEEVIE